MLAKSEIKRLFSATENVKHRTELMVAYSCDMRVSEVANLCIQDIGLSASWLLCVRGRAEKTA
ncbi:tyrosine-type recombinase/integrase [Fusibacter sp. JL298sf-3]